MKLTPTDVELVSFADITVGDLLISFTPSGKDIVIPPTQRQLDRLSFANADPRKLFTVPSVSTPREGIVEFGAGPDRWTGTQGAKVWRKRR